MRQRSSHAEAATSLDLVTVSCALWLGLMACGLGVQHLAGQAALPAAAIPTHLTAAQLMPAVWRR